MAVRGALRQVAVLLTVLTVLATAGCTESPGEQPRTPQPTPLADLATQKMVIARIDFCDLVPDQAVQDALGAPVGDHTEWGNGDPAVGAIGSAGEKAHELGCAWTSDDGSAARAWVFARPVTTGFARQVVRQAGQQHGCRTPPGAAFGSPSVLQVCTLPKGVQRVRLAGLFGDTWLSCEVLGRSSQGAGLRDRANAWCVQVANALDTARSRSS